MVGSAERQQSLIDTLEFGSPTLPVLSGISSRQSEWQCRCYVMFVTNKLACCGRRGKGCDGLLYWLLYANSWVFPYLFMLLYQLCIWLDWGNKLAAGIKYDWSPAFKDRLIWIHQAIAIYQYLLAIMTMLLFLWISVGRMYHFPR